MAERLPADGHSYIPLHGDPCGWTAHVWSARRRWEATFFADRSEAVEVIRMWSNAGLTCYLTQNHRVEVNP